MTATKTTVVISVKKNGRENREKDADCIERHSVRGGGERIFFYIEQLETECGTHEELPSGVVRLLCVSVSVCVCVCVIVKDRLMAD